jgi:hypothetical protein
MNVEIRTEAGQFLEKEYIDGIFLAVQLLLLSPEQSTYGFLGSRQQRS